MQTRITELKLEDLVNCSGTSQNWIRTLDFAIIDSLLEFSSLDLEHKRNPALTCFETVKYVLKEWLRQ